MKAVRCHGTGGPEALRLENVPAPTPAAGEVLVRVAACGVCFPDLLISKGMYQIRPAPPFTLGCEFAGTVIGLGPGVRGRRIGERVAGYTTTGAFAEELAVAEALAHPVPDGISFEIAAGFVLNYATAFTALKSFARLREHETVLVLGAAGGIGLAGVELAKALRGHVIACASTEEKRAVCRDHGADATIDYATGQFRARLREATADRGVDVVLDPVGGAYSEPAFRSLAWRGRHLIVGFAGGEIPKLPLNLPLLKGASMMGVSLGQFAAKEPDAYAENLAEIERMLMSGVLRPHVSAVFPIDEVAAALARLENRQAIGKTIIALEARTPMG